jgi:hypothetical protein
MRPHRDSRMMRATADSAGWNQKIEECPEAPGGALRTLFFLRPAAPTTGHGRRPAIQRVFVL